MSSGTDAPPSTAPSLSSSSTGDASTAPSDTQASPTAPTDEEKQADVKVILLGDSAVGKSKLVERFLMKQYVPHQLSTYALTVFRHKPDYKVNGRTIEVDFWDTAGQERFSSMHPSYYYRAHACILCFDVTRKLTYQNLRLWYKELQQYRKGIPIIVVANKIDMKMSVTKKKFEFATKRRLPFFFCSAADGTNVKMMFEEAIKAAVNYKDNPPDDFIEEVMRTIEYFDMKEKQQGSADDVTAPPSDPTS